MFVYLVLLLLTPPTDHVRRVDEIELNHVHDGNGDLLFIQAIAWDWAGEWRAVASWRMIQANPSDRPEPVRGGWRIPWGDGWVTARVLSRSWTQYDVEMAERQVVPVCERRGLR